MASVRASVASTHRAARTGHAASGAADRAHRRTADRGSAADTGAYSTGAFAATTATMTCREFATSTQGRRRLGDAGDGTKPPAELA